VKNGKKITCSWKKREEKREKDENFFQRRFRAKIVVPQAINLNFSLLKHQRKSRLKIPS
jgi:hypothetical protein